LSLNQPELLAKMQRALRDAVAQRFQTTNSSFTYSGCATSWKENVKANGNFAAPMCKEAHPPTDVGGIN
jgi:hypothetical protein